jgi:Large polyvalent protein-associated domain 7
MKADYDKQKKKVTSQRSAVQTELKSLSWDDWLVRQAEQGDTQALGILRKRNQNRKRIAQALLTISDLETAETVVRANAKPKTLKNGDVLYRVNDGGLVTDGADGVHVTTVTEASTILALSLADERFKDKLLKVDGTDEFKRQVAKAAAMDGCSVTFADSVMESNRQMYVQARKLSQETADQKKIHDGRIRESELTSEGRERGKGIERS